MKRIIKTKRTASGFSLLEVLIAVVILATGLLALAALQSTLARNSADAKVRSRMVALLSNELDGIRSSGYPAIVDIGADGVADVFDTATCTAGTEPCDTLIDAMNDAAVGGVTLTRTVAVFSKLNTKFAAGEPADPNDAQFKTITLTAEWQDATGATRTLTERSILSALALDAESPLVDEDVGGATPPQPKVRTDDPVEAGVIPIAIGSDEATAATNPRPEVLGKNNNESIVGTNFTVLTYLSEGGGVQIQKRIENSLIQCTCQYGAAGSDFGNLPVIYRDAQWPAIWNGDTYEVYAPDPASDAPGTAFESGAASGVVQSPLCMECCRDHHDTNATGVVKFDPERQSYVDANDNSNNDNGYEKYNLTGDPAALVKVNDTTSGTYINACRVIRVDGIWRVAADTYARHFGLLATETVAGRAGATGVPSTTATSAYQQFVKDYLDGYTTSMSPPAGDADTLFNTPARGLNDPASITIARPTPQDERYLHGRGLYVDHLEQEAQDKLTFAIDNCNLTPAVECILRYLPFNTVNVTELAFWEPRENGVYNNSTISVATGSSLVYDPELPTRGRTNALGTANNTDRADANAAITPSNAGLAISISGIDPLDDVDKEDAQPFLISASGDSSGGSFRVELSGLPQVSDANTSNDPAIGWAVSTESGNCNATVAKKDPDPNPYVCATTVDLGGAGSLLLTNYFLGGGDNDEYAVSQSVTASCTDEGDGNTYSVTATVVVPTFQNYAVTSAAIGVVPGTIGLPVNDAKETESTTVDFATISQDDIVSIGFTLQGTLQATISSCTTNGGHNQINNIVWTKPWELP